MLYQQIIRKLENTEPCYFDNCLLLAEFLRASFNQKSFPKTLLDRAEVLEKESFVEIKRYFEKYGYSVSLNSVENFDLVLMSFSRCPCLGTYIDGFIFYMDGFGMNHQSLETIGKYILYSYRMR